MTGDDGERPVQRETAVMSDHEREQPHLHVHERDDAEEHTRGAPAR